MMESFTEKMNTMVYPYINKRCTESYFNSFDGAQLRFRYYKADSGHKSVLIIHGFSEFIEKYDEAAYHFLQAGADVYLLELRGHGYSVREVGDRGMVHIDSFFYYRADIHSFVEQIMSKQRNEKILFAHSMGGGISANYIAKYPRDFHRVILSSPMIKMRTGKIPYAAAIGWSKVMCGLGKGKKFAVGQSGFPGKAYDKPMTEQQQFYYEKRMENTRFQTWGASYGWICAAGENSKEIASVSDLHVKMLVLIAGNDNMVFPAAAVNYAKRQKNAEYQIFENGRHELFNDTATVAERFWSGIYAFMEG